MGIDNLITIPAIANGTILPSRFVKRSTTDNRVEVAAAATDVIIGVSQQNTRDTPGLTGAGTDAASVGEPLTVIVPPSYDCYVTAGGTITAGDRLTATTAGKALATTTQDNYYGAIALEDASADELVRVQLVHASVPA